MFNSIRPENQPPSCTPTGAERERWLLAREISSSAKIADISLFAISANLTVLCMVREESGRSVHLHLHDYEDYLRLPALVLSIHE